MASDALARFGRVDVLVTNTGGPPAGAFESHAPQAWREAIAQNLDSVLNLTRALLPGMKQRGWGRIVNITSIAVKQPVEGLILSNSVRAAVTGFARTLANEVAPHGITVNNVLPGYTRTERLVQFAAHNATSRGVTTEEAYAQWEREIPMQRLGEPCELPRSSRSSPRRGPATSPVHRLRWTAAGFDRCCRAHDQCDGSIGCAGLGRSAQRGDLRVARTVVSLPGPGEEPR